MQTPITCPKCNMLFDSHETFTKTGQLVDEHLMTKHGELFVEVRGRFEEVDRTKF